jgi:hypothetical protein
MVHCHSNSIWYVDCIISVIPLPSDMLTVSYRSFHFHLICWVYHICHSTFIWYVECIISVILLIWYIQHIRWKWNDRYDTVNISHGSRMTDIIQSTYQMEVEWHMIQSTYQLPSDMLTVLYLSFYFHVICWLYHICHSTSIWYVDCTISVIPLPSDMLSVMIHSTYQMEVEWQIWYTQHIRWKWNDRYGTVNISDRSGMTDMIQSTFHFHLICWMYHICHYTSTWDVDCIICHSTSIWYVDCIISVILLPCDMLTVSYLSFHFYLICWDMIHSTYHMEVEWQIWYSQHIR